jgi:tetratricopeptide (TPR) repeat protein
MRILCFLLACAILGSGQIEDLLQKATDLSRTGDQHAAEALARKAVNTAPDSAQALALLGVILTRQDKREEANSYFERALAIDGRLTAARFNLALNQFHLGRLDAAAANLNVVLEQQPNHGPAILLLGTVTERLQDCVRAVALLGSVPHLLRQQPDAVVALARCQYSADRREDARSTLELLPSHPAGADAMLPGVLTALGARDIDMADTLLKAIRATGRESPRITYTAALVDYNAERFASTQSNLEQMIERGIRTADVLDLLAWAHHRQQHGAEAIKAMKESIATDPQNGVRYARLAQILLERNSYPEAFEAAKQAVELSAGSSLPYKVRGDAETALGLLKHAHASYTRAVSLNPRDTEALLMLATAEHRLWRYAEARSSFQKGLKLAPRDARFYLGLARVLLDPSATNDVSAKSKAVHLLETALTLEPSLSDAHYELGSYLLRAGDTAAAVPRLESAAKLAPSSSFVRLALANAYRTLGRTEDAAEQLKLFKSAQASAASSAIQTQH